MIICLLLLGVISPGSGAADGNMDNGDPFSGFDDPAFDDAAFPVVNVGKEQAAAPEKTVSGNSVEPEDPFAGFDEGDFLTGNGVVDKTAVMENALSGNSGESEDPFAAGFGDEDQAVSEAGDGSHMESGSIEWPGASIEAETGNLKRPEAVKNTAPQNGSVTGAGKQTVETGTFSARLSGYSKLGATWNFAHDAPDSGETDWRGLSRLRAELQLEADIRHGGWKLFVSGKGMYDFSYGINGRSSYTNGVLDEYEWDLELREAYVQGTLGDALDLSVGRQIAVWGRSDNFRVTDILNPLDNREPGLIDIEDLRLPLMMTKAEYYMGDWSLSLIALSEHRFDKNPPFGHDFFPGEAEAPSETIPSHTLENTEYAVELEGMFSSWDISFYWASIYNDQVNFIPSSPSAVEHQRVTMAGVATIRAVGNFLLIFETAHFRGLKYMNDYGKEYDRTDLLAGFEFRGLTDTSISLDVINRRLHGYRRRLETSPEFPLKDDFQAALRITRNLMNERLELTALLVFMGKHAENWAFERFTTTYRFADGWSLTGNLVLYQSGTGAMENTGDNDRVALEIRRDF